MLDEKDLQAIGQMMSQMKTEILTETTGLLSQQKAEILSETNRNMNLIIENVVTPQFNLLAESQREILEKLVPRSRVDDLEEEVRFLKTVFRQMSEEVQQLKKAN